MYFNCIKFTDVFLKNSIITFKKFNNLAKIKAIYFTNNKEKRIAVFEAIKSAIYRQARCLRSNYYSKLHCVYRNSF